jgi:hypothetical protein
MKSFNVANALSFAFIVLFFQLQAFSGTTDKSKHSSIEELVSKKQLKVNICGMGGYQGDCIKMSFYNLTPDTTFLLLEPGRILTSSDTLAQDILITREELLTLAPREKRSIMAFGFCSEASKAAPDSAGLFILGAMADSTLVVLAEFLDSKGNNYPEDAMQHAVWCLTDGYDLAGIYNADFAGTAELLELVAGLKGIENPWDENNNVIDQEQPEPESRINISGDVEIYIPEACLVDIYICDQDGKQWEILEEKVPYKPGIFQYTFRITAVNWPGGKYFLRVMSDDKLLYQKGFEL